jgi:hypothetical protein
LAVDGVTAAAGVGAAVVGSADAAGWRYGTWSIDRTGEGAGVAASFAVAARGAGTPLAVALGLAAIGIGAAAGVMALEGVGASKGVAPAVAEATAGNRVNPGGAVCPRARIGIKVTASAISTLADRISLLIPTSTCLSREVHCEKAFPFGQLLLPFQPRLSRCFFEARTSWIAIWRMRLPRSPPGFTC